MTTTSSRWYGGLQGPPVSPAWTHIDGPTNDARELLTALTDSRSEGLDPTHYDVERLHDAIEKMAAFASRPRARHAKSPHWTSS
jgi:hypothetical protein